MQKFKPAELLRQSSECTLNALSGSTELQIEIFLCIGKVSILHVWTEKIVFTWISGISENKKNSIRSCTISLESSTYDRVPKRSSVVRSSGPTNFYKYKTAAAVTNSLDFFYSTPFY